MLPDGEWVGTKVIWVGDREYNCRFQNVPHWQQREDAHLFALELL